MGCPTEHNNEESKRIFMVVIHNKGQAKSSTILKGMVVEKEGYTVWSCDKSPLALTLGRSTVKVSVRPAKLGGGTGTRLSIHLPLIGSGRRCVLRPEGQSPGQRLKQGNNFETGNNWSIVLPDKMADVLTEQENTHLHPSALKMRQRLQSAPEKLKSPMIAKTFNTPLLTGRKAFGAVNKMTLTPAVNPQEKKLLKPQETKVNHAPQMKVEEYPEVEKFIPYDPLEFERYSIPEDMFPVSGLALPGLACFPPAPHLCEEDLDQFDPLPNPSPVKMPERSDCLELDAFLQTLDELTVELPPEAD